MGFDESPFWRMSEINFGSGSLGAVAIVMFGIPVLVMWLWNLTIPELFGGSRVTYWQAIRLELITFLLLGMFRLF